MTRDFQKCAALALLLAAAAGEPLSAQHYDMKRWGADRGYHDAPYFRYEAEPDHCAAYSGDYLSPTDDQTMLQSEASNQQAITLHGEGYVTWLNDSGQADGLTLRYSVPWGTEAVVAVTDGAGNELGRLRLNTDHSWEYCEKRQGNRTTKPEIYSLHVRNDNEFVRMRFDETHSLLSRAIAQGESFGVRNLSQTPVTIDFVEIEKTVREECRDGWARWDSSLGSLQDFINAHQGSTVYIDEEYVTLGDRLNLGSCNLRGRGMWYTELHWDRGTTGFNSFSGEVRDLYLSSYQNQRYNSPDHGPNGYGSPGKCFNGSTGRVENVWVEHFECGGWLDGADGSYFTGCRFRNNYADGINLCNSSNCTVEHSSFRNNGDDDMASWSAARYCSNNTFRYNTAEHNWRASSLGFFGGGGHTAHHILVKDGLESGVRLVSDFNGPAFGSEGITFSDISIVHCSCIAGEVGRHGDFWGVDEGALHIESSVNYGIINPVFRNFDIIDSRGNAVFVGSGSHGIDNLRLEGISVNGVRDSDSHAIYFENARGSVNISGFEIEGVDPGHITNLDGGTLESGSYGQLQLTAQDVITSHPEPVPGCELRLGGMSWRVKERDYDTTLRDGDPVVFSVRIENGSDVDLPEGYMLRTGLVFDNGTQLNFPAIKDRIPAHGHVLLDCEWRAEQGGHSVTATLDPTGIYGDMVAPEKCCVTKRINVYETGIGDMEFDRTSGIDFQPIDLRWKTEGESDFGKRNVNPGDRIIFAAVIANTGTEDSPAGSKLGVLISPGGNSWTQGDNDIRWCDREEAYSALAAGEAKYFRAYGGNGSTDGVWTAREGTYNVLVLANDHANEPENRREDNTGNNMRYFKFSVPYVARELFADPDTPDDLTVSTGISLPSTDLDTTDNAWYTLTGQRLSSRPTLPGLYIHNRRIVTQ